MTIFFTGKTALNFWSWHATTGSSLVRPNITDNVRINAAPADAQDIRCACEHFHDARMPISVLVASDNDKRKSKGISYEVLSQSLPKRSFYKLNTGVYVASPELLFVRYARQTSLAELALIGCTLTGQYFIVDGKHLSVDRQPLTNLKRLEKYIASASGMYGIDNARRALKYVVPNSKSIRESELALMLSLPKHFGGYAIEKPVLNQQLINDGQAVRKYGVPSMRPDLLWPKARLAIEYESDEWHSGGDKFIEDSKRRNILRQMKYDVTTITNAEFKSEYAMDCIAGDIRRRLGKRSYRDPSDYERKKWELRQLIISVHQQGPCTTDFWM